MLFSSLHYISRILNPLFMAAWSFPTQLLIYTVSHNLFMKPYDTLWVVQVTLYLKALTLFLSLTLLTSSHHFVIFPAGKVHW